MNSQRMLHKSAADTLRLEDQDGRSRQGNGRHTKMKTAEGRDSGGKAGRFTMRFPFSKLGCGHRSKAKTDVHGKAKESNKYKFLQKGYSDLPLGTELACPGSPGKRDLRRCSRAGKALSPGKRTSKWNSCGRPRSLADLKSHPLRSVKSEESLKHNGLNGKEGGPPRRQYQRDDSSRQLNMLWEGEGGEESRSRLFSSLLMIENYDHD